MTTCLHCSAQFEITSDDLEFYELVSPIFAGKKELIPPPTRCPDCRAQRRLAHRNECTLYHRKCDATGKQMISLYQPTTPFPVFERTAWWSDAWDALSYGQGFDESQTFFAQFAILRNTVPRLNIFSYRCENSEYTNQSYDCKNCYLSSAIGDSEDLLYVQNSTHLTNAVDMSYSQKGELLYECTDTYDSYASVGLQHCIQCSDSSFLYDCVNCRKCFGCSGLRNKSYCIRNKKVTPEAYEREIASYRLDQWSSFQEHRKDFQAYLLTAPHTAAWIRQSENVTGTNIRNSHNCAQCFDIFDTEDARYSTWVFKSSDVSDVYGMGKSRFIHECVGVEEVQSVCFASVTSNSERCLYTDLCFSCRDCFGCIGLRNKQYCILNTQYTKQEYEELVPKIIEHMRATRYQSPAGSPLRQGSEGQAGTGQGGAAMNPSAASGSWGEFFPVSLSPFAYNETIAQEYFPLTREEVLRHHWQWHDEAEAGDRYLGPVYEIGDSIQDIPDDITTKILTCAVTGKPFKIIPQELKFYRQMHLPVPRLCPDQRRKERLALRNPRTLFARNCAKCTKAIQTTYSPECPEIVYCESCYLETVY